MFHKTLTKTKINYLTPKVEQLISGNWKEKWLWITERVLKIFGSEYGIILNMK